MELGVGEGVGDTLGVAAPVAVLERDCEGVLLGLVPLLREGVGEAETVALWEKEGVEVVVGKGGPKAREPNTDSEEEVKGGGGKHSGKERSGKGECCSASLSCGCRCCCCGCGCPYI